MISINHENIENIFSRINLKTNMQSVKNLNLISRIDFLKSFHILGLSTILLYPQIIIDFFISFKKSISSVSDIAFIKSNFSSEVFIIEIFIKLRNFESSYCKRKLNFLQSQFLRSFNHKFISWLIFIRNFSFQNCFFDRFFQNSDFASRF